MTLRIDCAYSADWLRVVAGDPAVLELEITSPVEDRTLSVLLEDRAQVETLRNALSLWLGGASLSEIEEALVRLSAVENNAALEQKWAALLAAVRG
jgi:hypothetical protein